MAILEIIKYPNVTLKTKCKPVTEINDRLRQLVRDMAETMYTAPGVGLAAPQVGHCLRVAVIDVTKANDPKNLLVLINPVIVAADGECTWEEGCLSIPGCAEDVQRSKKVTVHCQDLEGKTVEIEAEDLLAVALQHEIDHLDGILFIDHLSQLKRDLYRRKLLKEAREAKEGKKS